MTPAEIEKLMTRDEIVAFAPSSARIATNEDETLCADDLSRLVATALAYWEAADALAARAKG